MTAELIFAAANIVAESLVWDDDRKRLLWVDIIGKFIHALAPKTCDYQRWDTDDFVTAWGLRKDGFTTDGYFSPFVSFWVSVRVSTFPQ